MATPSPDTVENGTPRPPRLDPLTVFQHALGLDRRQARRYRRRLAKSCVTPPGSTDAGAPR